MTSDIEIEVYTAADCPATDATITKLEEMGCEYTLKPIGKGERAWLNYLDMHVTPMVFVWRGHGKGRRKIIAWEGHKPTTLEVVNRKLLEAGV